ATASEDHTVRLWDTSPGQQRAILQAELCRGAAVAFAPDGKTLAATGIRCHNVFGGETVWLWDTQTGQVRATIKAWFQAFSPDSKTVAGVSKSGILQLWDAQTGQERAVLKGATEGDYSVWLAGLKQAVLEGHTEGHTGPISPDGRTLASTLATSSRGYKVRLWD